MKNTTIHHADQVVANARNIPHRTRHRTVRQFFHHSTAPAGAKETLMPFPQKLGSSALFDNDRNNLSDLNGEVTLACPHCGAASGWWINAWRRTSQKGLNYIGLQLKPKRVAADEQESHR